MYIEHINMFDNKLDTACVVLIIEDILKCIKRILPNITRVILQSDNAIEDTENNVDVDDGNTDGHADTRTWSDVVSRGMIVESNMQP